jgi:type I restriction enzyme S subunit
MREDWVEIELGEVCDYSKGKKPKVLKKEYSEITPFPYVNIKAFEKGIFEEYTDGEKCNLCDDGDLLMVWDGARAGLTGKAKKGAIGSTLMKIEPKAGIDKNYLFYFLLSLYKKLNTNPRGVGIPHVEPRLLWDSIFLMPDIPTQRATVTKIENLFASLDNGIADLKKAQEQLKVYRQAVLKKAFEGELTKEWRENHVKTDGRPSQDNTTIPMAAEPTVNYEKQGAKDLPEGWSLVPLKYINQINPKPNKEEIDSEIEVQFLPMKLVEEVSNKIHLVEVRKFNEVQKKSYTYFEEGDILFAKVTPCMENGKIAIAKDIKNGMGYGSSEFHVLRCNNEILNYYLFYFLIQEKFRSDAQHAMTGAVGLRRVPKKFLEDYLIPLPHNSEQHQIVREIESRLSVCDKVEQNITEGLEKSEALRQSILKKAFEGKLLSETEIEKCKQEADYEPASLLLEKIKKEAK